MPILISSARSLWCVLGNYVCCKGFEGVFFPLSKKHFCIYFKECCPVVSPKAFVLMANCLLPKMKLYLLHLL